MFLTDLFVPANYRCWNSALHRMCMFCGPFTWNALVLNVVSGLPKQVQLYVTVSYQDTIGWVSPPPVVFFSCYCTVINMNYQKHAPKYVQVFIKM